MNEEKIGPVVAGPNVIVREEPEPILALLTESRSQSVAVPVESLSDDLLSVAGELRGLFYVTGPDGRSRNLLIDLVTAIERLARAVEQQPQRQPMSLPHTSDHGGLSR
jgi:hypothetical protein